MSVAVKWFLTGASLTGQPQTDPKESRGGSRSSTEITSPYAVFDNVTAVENNTSYVDEYRCVIMQNVSTASEKLTNLAGRIQGTSGVPQLAQFAWEVTDEDENGTEDTYLVKMATESTAPSSGRLSPWSQSINGTLGGNVSPTHTGYPGKVWIVPTNGYIRVWLSRRMGKNPNAEATGAKQATITINADYYT